MGVIKVEIAVPTNTHIFAPGDVIHGKVIYDIRGSQEKLDDVQVVFRGKMTTKITRNSGGGANGNRQRKTNREEIYLFKNSVQLFRGPFDMQPQRLEWPFEVQFPDACSWNREKHGDDQTYAPPGQIPLPPSFSMSLGSAEAVVDYLLKVKVNDGSLTRSQEQVIPLQFSPLAPTPQPDPILRLVSFPYTKWSSRELRPEKHDFKQKMRHVFTSDPSLKTPEINFSLKFGIPNRMYPGQVAPLALALTYKQSAPVDPEAPTLVLESLGISLKSNTIFRARSTFSDWDKDEQQQVAYVSYKCNTPMPLDGTTIHPVADFGIASFQRSSQAKGQMLPPDFISWTINHSHYVKANVCIRHKESGHLFEIKSERIGFQFCPPHERGMWMAGEKAPTAEVQLPAYAEGEPGPSMAPPYGEDQAGPSAPPGYDGPSMGYAADKQREVEMGSKAA
ncbi:Hypothetical protein D9617_6g095150 [Elsinoe fawcettii]|nr:Hypothetical protein D9617_6g095150 [Elsinoe fawcettii]